MSGDGPGSRARGVPERGARTGDAASCAAWTTPQTREQSPDPTADRGDRRRRPQTVAVGRRSGVTGGVFPRLPLGARFWMFESNHEIADRSRFSRFPSKVYFAFFFSPFSILSLFRHSAFSCLVFSIFFSHSLRAARDSSLRIRFLRNYVLLFARAPHVTHLRPRGARSRVRSGCRTRDGAVAALPSASQLARRTRERDRRETRARARDPSPLLGDRG